MPGSGTARPAPSLTTPPAFSVMGETARDRTHRGIAMLTRRKTLLGLAGLGLASLPRAARAQQGSNVRLVVPAAAGGNIDVIGRLYAERLRETLAQTWIVENRAGANNTLGAAEVARAAPDGTTLLTNADIHLMARHVMRQVPYDPVADFTPISRLATSPLLFVGHPAKTPADLKKIGRASCRER